MKFKNETEILTALHNRLNVWFEGLSAAQDSRAEFRIHADCFGPSTPGEPAHLDVRFETESANHLILSSTAKPQEESSVVEAKYFRNYPLAGTYVFPSYVVVRHPNPRETVYQRQSQSRWALAPNAEELVSALADVIPTCVHEACWTIEDIRKGCP